MTQFYFINELHKIKSSESRYNFDTDYLTITDCTADLRLPLKIDWERLRDPKMWKSRFEKRMDHPTSVSFMMKSDGVRVKSSKAPQP